MKYKKYTTELTILNKKNEQGKYYEKKPIRLQNLLELDGQVIISYGYQPNKRSSYCITATYNNITTIITSNPSTTLEETMQYLGKNPSDLIINRYKELQLI